MAQETRVGLLVGMGFIICFAVILSNRGGLDRVAPQMPYQLFGGPAAPLPKGRSTTAQEQARTLDVRRPAVEVAHEPEQRDSAVPQPGRRATPGESLDPQRLIQRRRSLLPSRELADGRTAGESEIEKADAAQAAPAEALVSAQDYDADPPVGSNETPPDEQSAPGTDEGERAEDPAPVVLADSAAPAALPAMLAGFSDQLEVVTSDRLPENAAPSETEARGEVDSEETAGAPSGATHLVGKGDSLSRIARRYYGSANPEVMSAIVAANPGTVRSPNTLISGRTLKLPVVDGLTPQADPVDGPTGGRLAASHPAQPGQPRVELAAVTEKQPRKEAAKPKVKEDQWRWYTVKKGDLFSTIAQRELGTAKRWKELLDLNKDVCPDAKQLRHGIQIRIPNGVLADAR